MGQCDKGLLLSYEMVTWHYIKSYLNQHPETFQLLHSSKQYNSHYTNLLIIKRGIDSGL